jgi:thioredoxin 2
MSPEVETHGNEELVEQTCSNCAARNRFPRRRLLDDPKCGRCHQPVFPHRPVAVTDATFRAEVEECPIPVLVDFWADWCGPCKMVAPVLERVAEERGGKLKVAKLDVDRNPTIASRFNVRSIPSLILFRGPLVVDEIVGALPKPAIDARLDRAI